MALNITSKAARDSPWFFSCVSRYIRWLATVRMCSTCDSGKGCIDINSTMFSNCDLFNKLQGLWYSKTTGTLTSKYNFLGFRDVDFKLVCSRPSLDVLKFLFHGNWTVLRNKYGCVICKFNHTVMLWYGFEIHRINQISWRSYPRTLNNTACDRKPLWLISSWQHCLSATCEKTLISNIVFERVWGD